MKENETYEERKLLQKALSVFTLRCETIQLYLVIDAIINVAYRNIETYDSETQDIIRRAKKQSPFSMVDEIRFGNLTKYGNLDNEVIEYIAYEMEIKDVIDIPDRAYINDCKKKLLYNYKEIISYKLPSLAIFTVVSELNSYTMIDKAYSGLWIHKIDWDDVPRHARWCLIKLLSLLENRKIELGNIPEKYLDRYKFHKSLNYRYIAFEHFGVDYKVIEKTLIWLKIYSESNKLKEMVANYLDVKRVINTMKIYKDNGLIHCTFQAAQGLQKIYDLEAHKLTDEAVRRYEILK